MTDLPFVSVCTPTFNRRPFIPIMIECFRNQTYPIDKIEWIIVDDGTDKIEDLIIEANIPQIKYFPITEKMKLGKKRNFMHSKSSGDIIVYFDDDDYYPPERIQHAVESLSNNTQALCAGSSIIYLYFKHINMMYKAGPYGPNHATAATFAFRKELLDQTQYDDEACLAEERHFLKNYTIPFVQLDPLKTILVFSHIHNSYDKRDMLERKSPVFNPSERKVDDFIKYDYEVKIKNFFMNEIEDRLKSYAQGDPSMKPDVLLQMNHLKEERKKYEKPGTIIMQTADGPPIALSSEDIVKLLETQKNQIKSLQLLLNNQNKDVSTDTSLEVEQLKKKNEILEYIVLRLKKDIDNNEKEIKELKQRLEMS